MVRFIGSGQSTEDAIKILGVKDNFIGVMAEYEYLEKKFGKKGIDWKLEMQALIVEGDKYYDKMVLKFSDGTKKTIYFDITPFFGKFGKGGAIVSERNKVTYTEGWLKLQVSDIEKAFKIIQERNVGADISTKEKTIEIDLDSFTVEELISILQELKPICVPLENSLSNILNEVEEEE